MDTFRRSTLDEYAAWLTDWLTAGHLPTHYHDTPFSGMDWVTAQSDFTTGGERGSRALRIIVPTGVRHTSGDRGHNCLYIHGDDSTGPRADGHIVPVFNDPVFTMMGINDFIEAKQTEMLNERHKARQREVFPDSDISRYLATLNTD